ncbi:hypothetical protein B296_00051041 [Ensete ventricosum]|uniref:Uncharacterized protein n=1 Tax=Ensete ventricosum TaxID=4639 RepID=A0A426YIL2_ENSVE|nr:hypothetical protein B296_00051041 [Ensete ventricosum]
MGEVNMAGDERDNEEVEEERELSANEAADEKESLSLGNNKEESNRQVRSSNVRMGRLERKIAKEGVHWRHCQSLIGDHTINVEDDNLLVTDFLRDR